MGQSDIRRRSSWQLLWLLAVLLAVQSPVEAALPTVVSTNICADIMALSLAEPAQLLSVSRKSQDPTFSPMADLARHFPANDSSAEEIIQLKPDIVLASHRWQARHQEALFARLGIRIVIVPFPTSWDEIFSSTRQLAQMLQRQQAGQLLLADVQQRLKKLQGQQRDLNVLYLRSNGGSAGTNTYVDTVLAAVGVRNHASEQGRVGWGRFPLEQLLLNPPDVFLVNDFVREESYSKSAYGRHPLLQKLLAEHPQVMVNGNYWGCSNWQLIEAAEDIAAQLDTLAPLAAANRVSP